MKTWPQIAFLVFLLVLSCGILSCAAGEDEDSFENVGDSAACDVARGDHHEAGRQDPQTNCIECHQNLTTCQDCHDNDDHTVERDGVFHMADDECCSWCHGPNKSGGLGPACTTCH